MEKPPSGPNSEPDPTIEHLRQILETMHGVTVGAGIPASEAASAEEREPKNPPESLAFICRIARNAEAGGGGPISVPLTDVHHEVAAGVRLENLFGSPDLVVTNPGAFVAGLQGMQRLEDPTEQQRQAQLLNGAIGDSLISFVHSHLQQHGQAVEEMYDGHMPPGSSVPLTRGRKNTEASPEQEAVYNQLPDHAATIAAEAERLGMHRSAAEAYQILNTAFEEGMMDEFAAAFDLEILTTADTDAIGVDRLSMPRSWDPTYKFLQYLRDNAPNARFTRQIRDTLLRDIERELAGGDPTRITPIPEGSVFMQPGDEAEAEKWRKETARGAVGMLRQAQHWIRHLLPIE